MSKPPPTTAAKRAETAILPSVTRWIADEIERGTGPDYMVAAFGQVLGKAMLAMVAARQRRGSAAPMAKAGQVSWTGPQGEKRKAQLVGLCREHPDAHPKEIAAMMGLRPSQVATAISKHVPKDIRTRAQLSGAVRPEAVQERAALPPADIAAEERVG
jgi:hypothetical protein